MLVTYDSLTFEMCKVSIKSNLDLHMRSHIRKLLASKISVGDLSGNCRFN